MSGTENQLVDGIQEVLNKITSTDYATFQVLTGKLEKVAGQSAAS